MVRFAGVRLVRGKNAWRVAGRRMAPGLVAVILALPLVMGFATPSTAATPGCGTPFLVYTDPANPGVTTETGDVTVIRDSGLMGEYKGGGRFAGYAISGAMDNILDTATGMARVQGEFVATSPDGGSSITVSYTGQVDFGAALATGNFTAGNGTGNDAGYRAFGTLEGTVVGPATLDGVDVGLC
jgi:hypothetical protein